MNRINWKLPISIESRMLFVICFKLFENWFHWSLSGSTSSSHLKSGNPSFHSSYRCNEHNSLKKLLWTYVSVNFTIKLSLTLFNVTPPVIAPPRSKYRSFNAPRMSLYLVKNYVKNELCTDWKCFMYTWQPVFHSFYWVQPSEHSIRAVCAAAAIVVDVSTIDSDTLHFPWVLKNSTSKHSK